MRHIFVLGTTLVSVVSATTNCWEIDRSGSIQTAVIADKGLGCAVEVTITHVASSYALEKSVPLLWGVQLKKDSSNSMRVPLPPHVMTPLSFNNDGRSVQILSTYIRTCTSQSQCSPSLDGNELITPAQSGNFSNLEATYFSTFDDISFPEEGKYTLAAVAVLGNAGDSNILYYFQTYVDIVVKDEVVTEEDTSQSTYCYVAVQKPLEAHLDRNLVLMSSDNSELELKIDTNSVVQANKEFDVTWIATLTRDSSKEIQLPLPLKAVYVPSDNNQDFSGYFTIVSSIVKLCERDMACDAFSQTTTVSSATSSSNFTSENTATFTARDIVVPLLGWYRGYAQVTLAGAAESQRYDFIKYFEVFATEMNMMTIDENSEYVHDGSISYCWQTIAPADDESVDATSVIFAGNSTNCPYTINMSVSETTCTVNTIPLVSWNVSKRNDSTGINGVTANTTTVYDASSGQYVNLPQVNIYYCTEAKCSPFSKQKTLVHSAQPMNFSANGEASLTSTISIPSEGTYALMAHAVVPNGDDIRYDVASFIQMTVTASTALVVTNESSNLNVGFTVGVTLGCVALVCLAALIFIRYRRRYGQQKGLKFRFFGFRPLSNMNEQPANSPNSIHGSDESGNFMYVKAQRSPLDMPRAFSLSYDPSSRTSLGHENSGYSFTLSESDLPRPSSIDKTIFPNSCDG
ncbi:uncharacterized protein PHALS_00505 [Plasmopara halstedii]|uniref:Immunoglobulin-like fold n=1 Tax=Plasmopara halstedii TaxID=4781 RepID=A0A0P1A6H0_PLAHL|nr:uncharacterized protein PHALS_00505 [Plasmopara halstedii]CEG36182.1 hypothetical protein PHALS_00505 [Plasmopara halstedii]|eukprot:XP_024572551.1 hypothetical protein PHALS_00505 [Plasmopara halstedii]